MTGAADDRDARLWRIVTSTVRPLRRHPSSKVRPAAAKATVAEAPPTPPQVDAMPAPAPPPPPSAAHRRPKISGPRTHPPPEAIEPGRRRRLDRGRDEPAATLDLHGLNQDQARGVLTAFILRGWAEHRRTILVITGKGALGDGVLRRRVPEWLAEPPLRRVVAGLSEAHRRHGGDGAIYVALKRAEGR